MVEGDNPPVGILLCTDKDQEHVEFATAGLDDKVFVSQYDIGWKNSNKRYDFDPKATEKNGNIVCITAF